MLVSSFIALIMLIIQKRYLRLLISIIIVGISSFFNTKLFPPVFIHLFEREHGTKFTSTIYNHLIDFDSFIKMMNESALKYLWLIILIIGIITLILAIKERNNKKLYVSFSLIGYFIYCFIISQVASYIDVRYYLPYDIIGITFSFICLYYLLENKKKVLMLSIIIICIYLGNFNYISENINKKKSWDFAKDNQHGVALVLVRDDVSYFHVNTLFMDFRWYYAVGMTSINRELDNDITDDFVLYVEDDLNEEDALDWCRQLIKHDINIIKQDNIKTAHFKVYKVLVN